MSERIANKTDHCLNRLILTEKDPERINPFTIMQVICELENLPEMKKLFRKCSQVSLNEEYIWDEGIPGNLLYIYEQFEKLIECCYLINERKKFKKKIAKKAKMYSKEKKSDQPVLPSALSLEEFMNPAIVINEFFEKYSLLEWKQLIHSWMEAGLSNFSVLENIKPKELLPYLFGMEKLLEASYRIADLSARKN